MNKMGHVIMYYKDVFKYSILSTCTIPKTTPRLKKRPKVIFLKPDGPMLTRWFYSFLVTSSINGPRHLKSLNWSDFWVL